MAGWQNSLCVDGRRPCFCEDCRTAAPQRINLGRGLVEGGGGRALGRVVVDWWTVVFPLVVSPDLPVSRPGVPGPGWGGDLRAAQAQARAALD